LPKRWPAARANKITMHSIASIRLEVEHVGKLLTEPSVRVLNQCTWMLEEAISKISSVAVRSSSADEYYQLQRAIRNTASLLRSAMDYHARWNQILASMLGGYSRDGRPAAIPSQTRLLISG